MCIVVGRELDAIMLLYVSTIFFFFISSNKKIASTRY